VEQWWHDTDRGKAKYWEKKPAAIPLYLPQMSAGPNPGLSGQRPVTILSHA
jgi:hypothetical protein